MAQVGFGTADVSKAAMLEIGSLNEETGTYAGIMPPRVDNQIQRNLIAPSISDAGLLIFVRNLGALQMWNGFDWINIYVLNPTKIDVARNDFDSNQSWSYTNNPVPYKNLSENDIWNVVNNLPGTSMIDNVSGNFFGCADLNNTSGGGDFLHYLNFVDVDITGTINPKISFDYDIVGYDLGDNVSYEVFVDGISQTKIDLHVGSASSPNKQGKVLIAIPNGSTTVRLTVSLIQDGEDGFAGFDDFKIFGQ